MTQKPHILLIEDNAVNRKMLQRLFDKLDCVSDMAANGQVGLNMAAEKRYDIIFMDCEMPTMDGFEATETIRRREQGTGDHTPIVAMTVHTLRSDRDKCMASGMDDFMSKPVNARDLTTVIDKWVKSGQGGNQLHDAEN